MGHNGNLGAVACLAGNRLDFHNAVMNFRYFQLKQTLDQTRMGAGQQNLRAVHALANLYDIDLDALTLGQNLARYLLALGQCGFNLFCPR